MSETKKEHKVGDLLMDLNNNLGQITNAKDHSYYYSIWWFHLGRNVDGYERATVARYAFRYNQYMKDVHGQNKP